MGMYIKVFLGTNMICGLKDFSLTNLIEPYCNSNVILNTLLCKLLVSSGSERFQ